MGDVSGTHWGLQRDVEILQVAIATPERFLVAVNCVATLAESCAALYKRSAQSRRAAFS
ncbi:hypothetical protein GKKCFE_03535 [Pseudomonas sp. E141]